MSGLRRRTRKDIEHLESRELSGGATRSEGAGRRTRTEEPDSYRTAFEVDRDRIMFSKAFRRLYPEAKIIFMSGYTDDIISRHGVSASEEALIQKPVRPAILARIIREVLDGVCRLDS